jgi:hypothetical protein
MNCKKKGHRTVICHNGKRLNANGQVASASATAQSDPRADFQEFQAFKQHQRQQQQQRHQNEECAQIASDFNAWTPFDTCKAITEVVSNVNACNPTPPLLLHLNPIRKPTFRIQVLADTGATRYLISLSTATKHGCKIKESNVCLSAANRTKINVAGMTSLEVVEKGRLVHTIVTIVSQNVTQTIVGWQDLKAMGVISSDWPAMPQQEDTIHAADANDKEKQLGVLKIHMLNKYNTVFSDTINEKLIAGSPMKIHLSDDIEIAPQKCYVARALPVHQQGAATKLKQELEAAGIIQNVDKPTAWTSQGFFVPKPNGGGQAGHRLCRSSRTEQPDLEANAPVPRSP